MKLKALLFTSLLVSPLALANMDIMAHNAYARATPPTAVNSAVFAEILNQSDRERKIVAAQVDVAGKSELHDVIKDGEMMKMRQVDAFIVPAKGRLQLQPGGNHIMLFELKHALQEGEQVNVELTFADGEKYHFSAPVKKVMAGMQMESPMHMTH